ncbi:MAG: ribbon-helix-helix protein, CopG family [Planctomycetota bacterium]|nr:ribbon-helix-helix protein, CopG family [Planctomycetota bacterium]
MRAISFSLPEDIFAAIDFAAAARGKSRSEYARDATIAYLAKYPPKGVIADIVAVRGENPKNMTAYGNPPATPE